MSTMVAGFAGAVFKKFNSYKEASDFSQSKLGYNFGSVAKTGATSTKPNKITKKGAPKLRNQAEPNFSIKDLSELSETSNQQLSKPTPSNDSTYSTETIEIYIDGSCRGNGQKGARAGIGAYFGHESPHNIAERLSGRQTNNRAEIHAAIAAVTKAKLLGYKHVNLKTDSKFMMDGINSWMPKWQKNNWKTSAKQDVKNKDDFIALAKALLGIKVTMHHVYGHTGVHGNEMADQLANLGATKPQIDSL